MSEDLLKKYSDYRGYISRYVADIDLEIVCSSQNEFCPVKSNRNYYCKKHRELRELKKNADGK